MASNVKISTEASTNPPESAAREEDDLSPWFPECANNGVPIDWEYWAKRDKISSQQAAKLTQSIDPIVWPVDGEYACGVMPDDVLAKVRTMSEWLTESGDAWTLKAIVAKIGDQAPYLMKQAAANPGDLPPPLLNDEQGLTKREQQIRVIEALADQFGYNRTAIPNGGKSSIEKKCKELHKGLFGAGPDPFKEAWQAAVDSDRIRMANHESFSKR